MKIDLPGYKDERSDMEIFDHLQMAYPDRKWDIEDHGKFNVISFVDEEQGMAITDPYVTSCSRFEQEDLYGIAPADARLIKKVNEASDRENVTGIALDVVWNSIINLIQNPPDDMSLRDAMTFYGFEEAHTGGGCRAYELTDPQTGNYILLGDSNGHLPEHWLDNLGMDLCDSDAELINQWMADYPTPEKMTLKDMFNFLKASVVFGQNFHDIETIDDLSEKLGLDHKKGDGFGELSRKFNDSGDVISIVNKFGESPARWEDDLAITIKNSRGEVLVSWDKSLEENDVKKKSAMRPK